jgi:hypothetical protein
VIVGSNSNPLDLLQQFTPVSLDRCLSTATHCDTLLHQRANEEFIGHRGIVSHQRDCTEFAGGAQRFVKVLAAIYLEGHVTLDSVQQSFRVSESRSVYRTVNTLSFELVDLVDDIRLLTEVDDIAAHLFGESESSRHSIDGNRASCFGELTPFACEQTNRIRTPDCDALTFFDICTYGAVIRVRDDVAEIRRLFIRDRVEDLKKIDVRDRTTNVFSLTTIKTAGEIRSLELFVRSHLLEWPSLQKEHSPELYCSLSVLPMKER